MRILICSIMIILFWGCTRQKNIEPIVEQDNKIIDSENKTEKIYDINEVKYVMYVNNPSGRITVYDAPFFNDNRDNRSHLNNLAKVNVIKEEGEIFNIGGRDGKWVYVISEKTKGWVFSGDLSLNEPQRIPPKNPFDKNTKFPLLNIADISKYIIWDLKLYSTAYAYSLDEFLSTINLPKDYSIIKNSSFPSKHSNSIIEEYFIIVKDSFKLTIWANDDDDRYLIMGIEVIINEKNYIHLFPYKTKNEYIKSDNFGRITEYGADYIEYLIDTSSGDGDYWILEFKNDILYAIKFATYAD